MNSINNAVRQLRGGIKGAKALASNLPPVTVYNAANAAFTGVGSATEFMPKKVLEILPAYSMLIELGQQVFVYEYVNAYAMQYTKLAKVSTGADKVHYEQSAVHATELAQMLKGVVDGNPAKEMTINRIAGGIFTAMLGTPELVIEVVTREMTSIGLDEKLVERATKRLELVLGFLVDSVK